VSTHPADRFAEFRVALIEQREFRLQQLRQLDEAAANAPPSAGDVHDQVSQVLRAGARAALKDVDDALARLRVGSYGRCERCATAIPYERLEILPMCRYCMRCQHDLELRSQ
jgi:DnaK suppressor protein